MFWVLFFLYGDNHTKPFPKHVWAHTAYNTICVHTSELLPDTERNRSGVNTDFGAWSVAEALCFYYSSLFTDHSSVPFTSSLSYTCLLMSELILFVNYTLLQIPFKIRKTFALFSPFSSLPALDKAEYRSIKIPGESLLSQWVWSKALWSH